MKKIFTCLVSFFLCSCEDVNDFTFSSENPFKEIAQQNELFSKMPKDELEIMLGFITLKRLDNSLGKYSNTEPDYLFTGKTVEQVMNDGKKHFDNIKNSQMKVDEEKEKKLLSNVVSEVVEKKSIKKQLSDTITVAYVKKLIINEKKKSQKDDYYVLFFGIKNNSDKVIEQINGEFIATDLNGKIILKLEDYFMIKIKPGETKVSYLRSSYLDNRHILSDLFLLADENFTTKFVTKLVSFESGEVLFDKNEIRKGPEE